MAQSDWFVKSDNIALESVCEGMARKILGYNDDIMLVRVFFEKGAIGEKHSHPHRQVSFVEAGRFEVEIGERKEILSAGDSFMIPAEVEHGAVCLEKGILIDVFTPVRDDFLL